MVHLRQGRLFHLAPLAVQGLLHQTKSPRKFIDGTAQGILRIDLEKARDIDDGEYQIAEFVADPFRTGGTHGLLQLAHLFTDLVPDRLRLRPVKPHRRGLVLDTVGPDQRRQLSGHTVNSRLFALLAELGLLPGYGLLRRGVDDSVAKNVGVTPLQLVIDMFEYIFNSEEPRLGGHLGVKDHLQQHIAEFARQLSVALLVDGFDDFIGLLE